MNVLKEIRAAVGGYFVKDCPLCGATMYGQDWQGGGVACLARPGVTHGTCPTCLSEGGYDPDYTFVRLPLPEPRFCPYCRSDPR